MSRRYPDGPRINLFLAIIGQMLPRFFPFDPLEFNLSNARNYGDVAYYHVGPLKVYQLNHPDLARQILVGQPEKFHKPRLVKRAFRRFAGNGLLTSDGALWRQQRKLIQPAFQHKHVAHYAEVMVEHALRMVDGFEDGQVREINAEMMTLTLGVVVKSLFGTDITGEAEGLGALMTAVLDAANQRLNSAWQVPEWLPTRRNLVEKRALAKLDGVIQDLIRARRAAGDTTRDLLSILLTAVDEDSGARMSDRQLRDEMMTLFLAGHETTANALTWTWYLLSQYPEVEATLHDELRQVLGHRAPAVARPAESALHRDGGARVHAPLPTCSRLHTRAN